MTAQSPPNALCHTVYADRTIGLTVTAWPAFKSNRFWMVHFHRWHHKAARQLLDQTAPWTPILGWGPDGHWRPSRHHLIPPAALAAVEAWLAEQAANPTSGGTMTTPTIRDLCTVLVNDVFYLLACIQDGRSDSHVLQQCRDHVSSVRDALAAEPVGEGPTDQEIISQADKFIAYSDAHMGDPARWEGSDDDLVAFTRHALARWGRPATPPALEPPAEALAARPLLEQMARLQHSHHSNPWGQLLTLSSRAVAWLRENLPGQPVAIEPRSCPTPGACWLRGVHPASTGGGGCGGGGDEREGGRGTKRVYTNARRDSQPLGWRRGE